MLWWLRWCTANLWYRISSGLPGLAPLRGNLAHKNPPTWLVQCWAAKRQCIFPKLVNFLSQISSNGAMSLFHLQAWIYARLGTLKRKYWHVDGIFVTDCTGWCHFVISTITSGASDDHFVHMTTFLFQTFFIFFTKVKSWLNCHNRIISSK